ncbi:MAG: Rrf2 family transcriptional regulator [Rhodothermaceae bacterium]|nr:Rrf2 family transcriptional regulator [Rhodothermaceae bacterium]
MNSSRFVVGTHIMVALAGKALLCGHFGMSTVVSSDELAFSVNTNPVVVRRLLSLLQKAGLVTSKAGRYGGTTLAASAQSITLRDVYEAVEEEGLFHAHYQGPNMHCAIGNSIEEILESPLSLAEKAMKEALSEYTIEGLVLEIMQIHKIGEKIEAGMTYEEIKQEFDQESTSALDKF